MVLYAVVGDGRAVGLLRLARFEPLSSSIYGIRPMARLGAIASTLDAIRGRQASARGRHRRRRPRLRRRARPWPRRCRTRSNPLARGNDGLWRAMRQTTRARRWSPAALRPRPARRSAGRLAPSPSTGPSRSRGRHGAPPGSAYSNVIAAVRQRARNTTVSTSIPSGRVRSRRRAGPAMAATRTGHQPAASSSARVAGWASGGSSVSPSGRSAVPAGGRYDDSTARSVGSSQTRPHSSHTRPGRPRALIHASSRPCGSNVQPETQ